MEEQTQNQDSYINRTVELAVRAEDNGLVLIVDGEDTHRMSRAEHDRLAMQFNPIYVIETLVHDASKNCRTLSADVQEMMQKWSYETAKELFPHRKTYVLVRNEDPEGGFLLKPGAQHTSTE